MGNEFGHPEWIDFPREGNQWSYHHARRQWSLADSDILRYKGLNNFDREMMKLDDRYGVLEDRLVEQLLLHAGDKVLAYRRGPLVFVFNFHPSQSFTEYRIPVPDPTDYKLLLNTDEKRFEGFGLVTENARYGMQKYEMYGRGQSVQMYLPCRSGVVLGPG
jgi:1,4-alpha-glucan branching enzyme